MARIEVFGGRVQPLYQSGYFGMSHSSTTPSAWQNKVWTQSKVSAFFDMLSGFYVSFQWLFPSGAKGAFKLLSWSTNEFLKDGELINCPLLQAPALSSVT